MYLGRKGDRCAAELPVENYSFCTCGALGWNDVRYYTVEKVCAEPLTAEEPKCQQLAIEGGLFTTAP